MSDSSHVAASSRPRPWRLFEGLLGKTDLFNRSESFNILAELQLDSLIMSIVSPSGARRRIEKHVRQESKDTWLLRVSVGLREQELQSLQSDSKTRTAC